MLVHIQVSVIWGGGFQAARWEIRNPNPTQDWGMPVHLWSGEPGSSLTRAIDKEMDAIEEEDRELQLHKFMTAGQ